MEAVLPATSAPLPRTRLWVGRFLSIVPASLLLVDGVAKLFKPEAVVKGTVEIGYSENVIIPLGIVLIVSSVLFLIPRTALWGAILLTGYLGGAVATHVIAGHSLFQVLFPAFFASLMWTGLALRDRRLAALVF